MASGVVRVCGVRAGIPVRPSSARTSWSGMVDMIALPTPVQCGSTCRPTSVNMRTARGEGTCAT